MARDFLLAVFPQSNPHTHQKSSDPRLRLIKQKDLLGLTGYVHGGCSPVGLKKSFPTFVHISAEELDHMFVSAGKVGYQIELAPEDLKKAAHFQYADLV